jgi:uncharacterized protein YvpB
MKILHLAGSLLIWVAMMFGLPAPARAGSLPPRAYIRGFTGHAQSANLSCEARSAADWAAYWGVRIGEKKFMNRLPHSANPDEGFVGDPNDAWGNIPPASYGVHAGPVAALLRKFGLQAEARRNLGWDDLRAEITAGRPVIVWVVGPMWRGTPVSYISPDGHKTTVARYEHSMVLTGYEPGKVQVVDASNGARQTYPLTLFLASWGTLGRMAVLGSGREKAQPTTVPIDTPAAETKAGNLAKIYLPLISRDVSWKR